MSQITWANKVTLDAQPDIARINKVIDDDMNEIKTAHNDTDNKVAELMTKDYCVATISSQQTAGSNYKVQLNSIDTTDSNIFSLLSGDIKIGAGVSKIKVSACIFLQDFPANNYLWGRIQQVRGATATSISTSITNGVSSGTSFSSSVITEKIIDVQEDDLIRLSADSPGGGIIRSGADQTWIFIEKVA